MGDGSEPIVGIVKEIYKTQEGIKVKLDCDGENKDFFHNQIVKIKQ